jgi:hypothetical protein
MVPESLWAHYNRLRGPKTNTEFFRDLLRAMEAEMGKEAEKTIPEALVQLRELHDRAYSLVGGILAAADETKKQAVDAVRDVRLKHGQERDELEQRLDELLEKNLELTEKNAALLREQEDREALHASVAAREREWQEKDAQRLQTIRQQDEALEKFSREAAEARALRENLEKDVNRHVQESVAKDRELAELRHAHDVRLKEIEVEFTSRSSKEIAEARRQEQTAARELLEKETGRLLGAIEEERKRGSDRAAEIKAAYDERIAELKSSFEDRLEEMRAAHRELAEKVRRLESLPGKPEQEENGEEGK